MTSLDMSLSKIIFVAILGPTGKTDRPYQLVAQNFSLFIRPTEIRAIINITMSEDQKLFHIPVYASD